MRQPKAPTPRRLVSCASCRHFQRDTQGLSRNIYTGHYFMGTCALGHDPDHTFNESTGKAKIFADKQRGCNSYKLINHGKE